MKSSVAVREQRRRDLMAAGIALLIHLLIIGSFILAGLLFYHNVQEYRGPVLVKLGRPEAPDKEANALPANPVNAVDQAVSTPDEKPVQTEEKASGVPEETVKPQENNSENAVKQPVSDQKNGQSGEAEKTTEQSSGQSATPAVEAPPADVTEPVTVTKGKEEGNAWETTFDATPGLVGRAMGSAIYLYLPVPQFINQSIFDSLRDDPNLVNRTAEKKRAVLGSYYEKSGGEYILKNQKQPPYDERPQIWSLLAEGGYDMNNPEYKQVTPPLRDLVITFVVEVGTERTKLTNVQVNRSSGNSEIDAAVIYGFQKAVFSNSSDTPVKGRFTYRFQ